MSRATRVVAYIRVSTDKQAEHGISLEAQRAKLEAYASLYDLELVALEVDAGESASSLERPALKRALGMLRAKKADALLVTKLDRLTRSIRDLCDLVERYFTKRCALLSVAEQVDTRSAAGRMMLNVLTSVAQWEREAIGERTAVALAHKRARGEYTGGDAPLGFAKHNGELVAIAGEVEVIGEIRRLRAHGLSVRAIAATLEDRDLRGAVTPGKVQRVLARCGAVDTPGCDHVVTPGTASASAPT